MNSDPFKKNILPHTDKLYRLALSITGNKQDAEDVVQDVLLNVWKRKESWEQIENWESYCLRSVRNVALDKLELKGNQQLSIPDNFDVVEQRVDAQGMLEEQEQMWLLEQLIRRLPEKQRTIFQLRETEEMSYKEIAQVLNLSEEQVKVNLFRARQRIKDYFDKHKNG